MVLVLYGMLAKQQQINCFKKITMGGGILIKHMILFLLCMTLL